MSTSSNINVKVGDKYHSVYCHFDGCPTGVGSQLFYNYNSQELAESLVSLGFISAVGDTVEDTEYYGRDRGETGVEYEVRDTPLHEESYCYIWNGTEWVMSAIEYDSDNNTHEYIDAPLSLVLGLEEAEDGDDQDEHESIKVLKFFGCNMDIVEKIYAEWDVTFNTPDERMTPLYNERNRFMVRHRNAPYQGMDEDGIWHHSFFGRTLYEAVTKAEEYILRAIKFSESQKI